MGKKCVRNGISLGKNRVGQEAGNKHVFFFAPFIFQDFIYPLYDDTYFARVTSIFVLMILIMS